MNGTPEIAQTEQHEPASWRGSIRLILFSVCLFVGLIAVLTFQFLPGRYQFNEGDVSTFDIRSPAKVSYISTIKTNEERDRVAATVADVYTYDTNVSVQQKVKLSETLRQVEDIRRQVGVTTDKVNAVKAISGLSLSDSVAGSLVTMSDTEWQQVESESARVLDIILRSKIAYRDLNDVTATIPSAISLEIPPVLTQPVAEIVQSFIQPNYLLDSQATEEAREKARAAVPPVRYTIEKGEMILRDGDIVRPVHLEILEAAGLRNPTINWMDLIGTTLIVGILVSIMSLYLKFYRPGIIVAERRLLLIAIVIIVAVLAAKLVIPGREIYGYIFPAAAVSMLIATLLDAELALMPAIVVAVLVGFISNSSLEFAALALVGGVVGMIGARRTERMNTFFITGIEIAAANFLVILGFHLGSGDLDVNRLAILLFVSVVNGGLCAALTLGTFSVLGHIFGITTSLGLLELAHPSQPLFRRLLTEAPGTYHHSVVVANLAERAAQAIGADALLARVGAYYHDIGKVVHPYFFIENQLDGQNVHDQMDPRTSGHAIAAHVADGVSLAQRHSLPNKVVDIIEQHHGTTLVRYFYHQACKENGGAVSPDEFTYAGPKPQTREAAIVMLADSVEAMVRANRDHSIDNLNALITKGINDRMMEGQLDQCDLTMRDIEAIKKTFVIVLQGIFHPRVTYPDTMALPRPDDGGGQKGWAGGDTGKPRSARSGAGRTN